MRLKRRFAFASRQDCRFFQIEVALQPAPRFVGDLAVAQQLLEELTLGRDQLQSHVVAQVDGFESAIEIARDQAFAMVVARVESGYGLGTEIAFRREFLEVPPRGAKHLFARGKLGLLFAPVLGLAVMAVVSL